MSLRSWIWLVLVLLLAAATPTSCPSTGLRRSSRRTPHRPPVVSEDDGSSGVDSGEESIWVADEASGSRPRPRRRQAPPLPRSTASRSRRRSSPPTPRSPASEATPRLVTEDALASQEEASPSSDSKGRRTP